MLRIAAPAKINLRLIVLARDSSGFHQIETLFATLRLADELVLTPGESGVRLRVEGADVGPTDRNLVVRAAAAFQRATGIEPSADVVLIKRIPAGSGLGGGSSDAAAMLAALQRIHGDPLDRPSLLMLGRELGSDVPYFLHGSPYALAWGRGERCLPLDPPAERPVLLGIPSETIATANAYAELARYRQAESAAAPEPLPPAIELSNWEAVTRIARNDFEAVILPRLEEAHRLIDVFTETGATLARLTGSGSAVFGIFRDERACDRAEQRAAERVPAARLIRTATAFTAHDMRG
jgi:4-diphosphocytidyl-2-C-methyl-D-erythritol kinase